MTNAMKLMVAHVARCPLGWHNGHLITTRQTKETDILAWVTELDLLRQVVEEEEAEREKNAPPPADYVIHLPDMSIRCVGRTPMKDDIVELRKTYGTREFFVCRVTEIRRTVVVHESKPTESSLPLVDVEIIDRGLIS